jgi:precorrin-4 methylase
MGLKELKKLIPLLNKYYKDSTPISIAYNAGISRSEQLVRSTLKDILSKTDKEQEKNLGMIYIGPCLDKKSSECH